MSVDALADLDVLCETDLLLEVLRVDGRDMSSDKTLICPLISSLSLSSSSSSSEMSGLARVVVGTGIGGPSRNA